MNSEILTLDINQTLVSKQVEEWISMDAATAPDINTNIHNEVISIGVWMRNVIGTGASWYGWWEWKALSWDQDRNISQSQAHLKSLHNELLVRLDNISMLHYIISNSLLGKLFGEWNIVKKFDIFIWKIIIKSLEPGERNVFNVILK